MEDEDLIFDYDKKSFVKRFYIYDVFKRYGIVYGLIALIVMLCNVIILIPGAAILGYKTVEKVINFLSAGNTSVAECYWAYLIVSLVGILVIWITIKVCDKIFATKSIAK